MVLVELKPEVQSIPQKFKILYAKYFMQNYGLQIKIVFKIPTCCEYLIQPSQIYLYFNKQTIFIVLMKGINSSLT